MNVFTVHGGWGEWEEITACSASCGGGTQSFGRLCNNPEPANGGDPCPNQETESTKTEACNTQSCPPGE